METLQHNLTTWGVCELTGTGLNSKPVYTVLGNGIVFEMPHKLEAEPFSVGFETPNLGESPTLIYESRRPA